MPRRALHWLALAWGWSILWPTIFFLVVVRLRGMDVALGMAREGRWQDYLQLALVIPYLAGFGVVNTLFRKLHPEAPPSPAALRFGPGLLVGWAAPVALAWLTAVVAHLLGAGELEPWGGAIVARKGLGPADSQALAAQLAAAPMPHAAYASLQALVVSLMMYTPLWGAAEVGWRGVLDRELAPLGPLKSALLGAGAWALSLVPFALLGVYYPGAGVTGVLALLAGLLPVGLAAVLLRRRGGTPWASAALLGTLMALTGFHELLFAGGDPALQSVLGPLGGALVLGALGAVVGKLGLERAFAPSETAEAGPAPELAPAGAP
jgi:hypothetical protein